MAPPRPRPEAVCLMGPTASGKTDLAVALVERLPMEIVSVDSAQVYRGMDIGTGKPDPETLQRAPHHLIDILDPVHSYSAADFRRDALERIDAIRRRGRVPLLVGGTMLYFKALRDGLAPMPAADEAVRRRIDAFAAAEGWPAVHRWLASVDPESARRIQPGDPQRLQRALEVYLVSGRTMTELHRRGHDAPTPCLQWLAIQPPTRRVLHDRIATRFHRMLARGFVEEVELLHARGDLSPQMPSMRSVGYRQIWQYLEGALSFDAMVERGIIATRQLAKRQITWLRGWQAVHAYDSDDPVTLSRILKLLEADGI